MELHITENSLRRMAEEPMSAERADARTRACDPTSTGHDYSASVAYRPQEGQHPLENVAQVTCAKCRVLIDGALERRDVTQLLRLLTPASAGP